MTPLLALFDVDGTLLLTHDQLSSDAFLASLRELYGVNPPADAVERVDHAGQTSMRIAREVLRAQGLRDDTIDARLGEWCALFADRYVNLLAGASTDDWQLAPGAGEALSRLAEAGIRLALLTGNPEPMARARMRRLSLEQFFPVSQGAFGCDAEGRAALVAIARERAGAWPEERTVTIGDTRRDVSGAHAAGIRAVAIGPGITGADAVCGDLNEAADVLIAWNRRP